MNKKKIARKIMKLEQALIKAKTLEEKEKYENLIQDVVVDLTSGYRADKVDMTTLIYIDNYVQNHIKVDN